MIPYLKKCKFCIGNDTGFSHLSVNLDIETMIIQGDCPPQTYTSLIKNIDIDPLLTRSTTSIQTIKDRKSFERIIKIFEKERWPSG